MTALPTSRPNDDDEYTDAARLTDHYAATLTARIDYTNRLTILGNEINNDGVPRPLGERRRLCAVTFTSNSRLHPNQDI
jgi:hypothetical protein